MSENVCITAEGRKYGLWSLDETNNKVIRKCKCCGIEFSYPIDKDKLGQIKKQYEAIPLLESFMKLSPNNPNLIGYFKVILDDVVDYIDDTQKFRLDEKLSKLNLTSCISDENKFFIEKFRSAIKSDDNDLFFDTMEKFVEENAESLNNFVVEDEKKGFSK